MSPTESCKAICDDLQECGITIAGSSLAAGTGCNTQCTDLIAKNGDDCKTSASNLGECFDTYTCAGIEGGCSSKAKTFAEDCP